MLCSMTITVSPLSTIRFSICNNFLISSLCKPVVGSSKMKTLFPVGLFCNSLDSLTLPASPPDRVVADCPRVI